VFGPLKVAGTRALPAPDGEKPPGSRKVPRAEVSEPPQEIWPPLVVSEHLLKSRLAWVTGSVRR